MANNAWAVTLYGEILTVDNLNGGIMLRGNGYSGPDYRSLPVATTQVKSTPYAAIQTKWGTVYVQSIVEVYPMGLQIPATPRQFISDITVAAANTART